MTSGHLTLDPLCIVKQGYLIKSPPQSEATIIRKRWRMRWFLLYDTQARCDIDPGLEREVDLYYYKSDKHVVEGTPKGAICLKDVQIYGQRGRLHGYDHVINIQTNNRLYHLCATQIFVYNSWLDKLRERYVPYQEAFVERPRSTSYVSNLNELRRGSAPKAMITETPKKLVSRSFDTADDCDSDGDRYDYAYDHCSQYSAEQVRKPARAQTEYRYNADIRSWLNETPIPKYVPPTAMQISSYEKDDEDETDYVGMADLKIPPESEDEGIGRTDSDSSNVSSGIIMTAEMKESIPTYKSRCLPRDSLYSDGFVGPKLSTRSSSVGDMPTYVNLRTIQTIKQEF